MGAMQHLTLQDMDWQFIRTARHLHLGCFFLQTGIRADVGKLFAKAKKMGLTTSLDTNWDPDEKWDDGLQEALPFTDIFFPNDDEALRIANTQDLQKAMEFLGKQVKILVVKKGAAGATAWVNNEVIAVPPYAVPVVETTGAGDSFNAGFLHHFVLGKSLQDCLAYGNACGALAVTALGGTGAFRDRSVVSSKLRQIIHGK
jgi:sugar/nucleoside kinase (ribokinase family)